MIRFKQSELPHVQELENLILEHVSKIGSWDITALWNYPHDNFKIDDISITRLPTRLILSTTYGFRKDESSRSSYDIFFGNESSRGDVVPSQYLSTPRNNETYRFDIIFNTAGEMISYIIQSGRTIHSVSIGNIHLMVNGKDWYKKDTFKEEAFQYSLVSPKSPFDLSFVETVISQTHPK